MKDATHRAIEAVWRIECARIVATVARLTHDISLAEECAQDALVAALEHWPREGTPNNPAAWLTTTAKHRALDHLRHHSLRERKHGELALDLEAFQALIVPDFVDALDERRRDPIGDDLLRLIFIACHPVLKPDARAALTLRLLGGLDTGEIARAYLVPEPTIAQRIVRAKKTLSQARVPFELPPPAELPARLASVLEVLYLMFNAGYSASQTAGAGGGGGGGGGDSGRDAGGWTRPALCQEAVRLGRILANVASEEPEVLGLLALMELQASRLAARHDAQGRPVLLMDQDRGRWDRLLIRHGLAVLERAETLCARPADKTAKPAATPAAPPGTTSGATSGLGPYALQAAIAACHARAARADATDWPHIAALYAELEALQPSPVVTLNRAVAVGMAQGPAAGLALLAPLQAENQLSDYPWLHSVRGDLLQRLGQHAEARTAFLRAAELAHNDDDRTLLLARAEQLATPPSGSTH